VHDGAREAHAKLAAFIVLLALGVMGVWLVGYVCARLFELIFLP
jgi:hypothetical protein